RVYAQPGGRRPADSCQTAGHFPAPAILCDPLRRGRGTFVLRLHHPAFCGPLPQEYGTVPYHDHQAVGLKK
ncbi:hypothetical protein OHPBIL_OHPBIL_01670, partial [Dysosmobacter welbionis]